MHTRPDEQARPRDVLHLAWPIMVSMASYSVMSLVDSIFVARLGTSQLAAVGLASSTLHLTTAFWVGAFGAVRILVAQASGAGRPQDARTVAWHGLYIALLAGLFTWLLLPFGDVMLWGMGASEAVISHGRGYLSVRLAGSVVVFLVLVLQGWFQGRGDTRTPMLAILLGNALNIGLDPVFIHGLFGFPALGVTGAALATLLAWVVQLAWLGVAAMKSLGPHVQPRWSVVRRLRDVGGPIGTHLMLDVAAFGLFAIMLASVGDAHVAAHVVVVRILMTSFLPGHAVGEATGVLVGRAVGSGHPEVARQAVVSGAQLATGVMAGFGVLFLTIPGWLVVPFGAEPEVLSLVVVVLSVAGLVQVFDAVGMVALGALNGAGDTRFSMAAGLTLTWFVKVPVSAWGIYVVDLGVVGAWLGIAVELVLLAAVAVHRVRGRAWLEHAPQAL